ncbi:hypothetical protein QYF36_004812 [Acer negundo]|nr:hypothetical protein QYF36_004812 [Acer negundo]
MCEAHVINDKASSECIDPCLTSGLVLGSTTDGLVAGLMSRPMGISREVSKVRCGKRKNGTMGNDVSRGCKRARYVGESLILEIDNVGSFDKGEQIESKDGVGYDSTGEVTSFTVSPAEEEADLSTDLSLSAYRLQ